ncbi:hypothetical protein CVT25_006389 [Psilocybe cyanescens]|uniref:Uncharacterized protein n=1 Tax=Psilocybe cyanescens TaxID=93625 RepID=A0A409XKI7_PSICY|nr:hypothetical protein CVT25_006389 [Psilocybe cyanescens]
MANDNSQSPKNSKESFHSLVVEPMNSISNRKRSNSPAPSEGSQGHSSKSKFRNFFRYTNSSTDIAPVSVPPNRPLQIMGSPQYPDHRTLPVLSGSEDIYII